MQFSIEHSVGLFSLLFQAVFSVLSIALVLDVFAAILQRELRKGIIFGCYPNSWACG